MKKLLFTALAFLGISFTAHSQIPTDNSITYRNNEPIRLLSKLGFEFGPKDSTSVPYFRFDGAGTSDTNQSGQGTFSINTTNGTDGVFINGTNLTELLSQQLTPKKIPYFEIPLNVDTNESYNGFQLVASTNNFSGSLPDVFDCRSEIAGVSSNRMLMFVCTGTSYDDPMSAHYIETTNDMTNKIGTVLAIVDKIADWMDCENEDLTWVYRRYRISGGTTNYENEAGTSLPLWRPIIPSRWYKEIPSWSTQAIQKKELITLIMFDDGTSETSEWFEFKGGLTQETFTNAGIYDNGQWIKNPTDVIIGSGVTSIGDSAFSECTSLSSVTIGNSVTNIGDSAFYGCTSLASIIIPNSVINIGEYAFSGCTSLESITIPDSVTSIGGYAFNECFNLTSITIGNSVESIGEYAFSGCTSLSSVTIGNSVESIGRNAFIFCTSLTSITIPNSVESIGESAFYGCTSLTDVTIGNSVTSIGDSAFSECTSLSSVTIGNSVTSIGRNAFVFCTSLTSITIPNSVESIGEYTFYGCTSLESITIPNSVESIGEYTFYGCTSLTDVTIGNSVTSIGDSAFSECTSLASIIIPNSVINIGEYAFNECSTLMEVTMDGKDMVTVAGEAGVGGMENYSWGLPTGCNIHCTNGTIILE